MKLTELKPAVGAKKKRKRVGRGYGSGLGKTCGRGSNGQNSRSGGGVRIGFEGGQMPLVRRIPKRGFSNFFFKNKFILMNLNELEQKFVDKETITIDDFIKKGIIKKNEKIKILGNGELKIKKIIEAHAVSASAKHKIEKNNGKIEIIN
ncbi:MAG: 50S ribosomal protein L15 [Elusimicrobiota bacterium]|jgi:large subunit ribosomal protein L15|nr:50S ribosomal protein L15 [Elusimicrobiota bacterium]